MRFNYTKHWNIMTKEKDVEKYFFKVALHTYRPNNLTCALFVIIFRPDTQNCK